MTDHAAKGLSESSRRGYITRVLVVYLGASYAVLEIVDIFIDQLGLPDWFFPGVIVLLLLGLPIVVATALVQSRNRAGSEDRGAAAHAGVPASAAEFAQPMASESGAAEPPTHWLTWRKAIVGFVAAFALWGLVVAVYMTMRAIGVGPVGSLVAAGVIEEREHIVLADFENNTNDPLLGRVATEAFRIDLSQSSIVTLISPATVDQVLVLMQRDPGQSFDEELAREMAIREGIKAVVAGDVTPVGTGYVFTARLVGAQEGQVLAASRETAGDSTAIIGAIDRLSKKLRERIGESLKTIRESEPLDQVTTSSLDALRKYSQAVRLIDQAENERAITLLEEAVALDSSFAMAWRKLGVTLGNMGRDRTRQIEALTQAYEHRDRLSDRERHMTEGSYFQGVTGESDRAAAAYRSLLDISPDDPWAMNNLALIYFVDRDYRQAARLFERAIEVDSAGALYYGNAVEALFALGETQQAEEVHSRHIEKFPGHPTALADAVALASAQFDYDLAEERLRQAREVPSTNRMVQVGLTFSQAQLAEIRGQLGQAERMLEDVMLQLEQQGDYANYLGTAIRIAVYDLMLRSQRERAIERVRDALARHPLEEMSPLDRPYEALGVFYALAGMRQEALAMLDAAESVSDPHATDDDGEDEVARAVLAADEGKTEEAIRYLKAADRGPCPICVLPVMGRVYDAAVQTDSVIAIYQRYVDSPWLFRLASTDWWALAAAYERLGGLYELKGETEEALFFYNRFVGLWENADPELQPRVDAARRAIERLSEEGL
jgi:tetratricopeptide (TPR) repeat protein